MDSQAKPPSTVPSPAAVAWRIVKTSAGWQATGAAIEAAIKAEREAMFALVFNELAEAQADGATLDEAALRLERAVCERYRVDGALVLGLVAMEQVRKAGIE